MKKHTLLAGTSKGLVVFRLTESKLAATEVHFKGQPVSMVYRDERNGTWWIALSHRHWGDKIHFSTDEGKTWSAAGTPSYQGYDYKPGTASSLKKIWVMHQAGHDRPNAYWIGTEPGGLFFTEDGGKTFQLNESLWNHPSRLNDLEWFGTGNDFPFIHSIIVDPRNSNHIYVGVSCAGVFKTTDGGKSWSPNNNGLYAGYLPRATPDVGHDPHQMLQCQSHPDVIWQQNHCGIFRSTNGGEEWKDVSGKNGFPQYGFALAIDHKNPDVAWVIPAESDESRVPRDLKLEVYQTTDGGKSWKSRSNGLPTQHAFDLVLRHGFTRLENIMVFGTNNGNLYCSHDEGESWNVLATSLAPVNSVIIA
jgi:photosystem II stability/assembly factor-like uncharacterized protein